MSALSAIIFLSPYLIPVVDNRHSFTNLALLPLHQAALTMAALPHPPNRTHYQLSLLLLLLTGTNGVSLCPL
jgi:hypothetical protein